MIPEEVLKKKGITSKTKYHSYDYLYNSIVEILNDCERERMESFDIGFTAGSNEVGARLSDLVYNDEQIIDIVKFTIEQWSSLNEKNEPDHKDLVNNFIKNTLPEWFILNKNKKNA